MPQSYLHQNPLQEVVMRIRLTMRKEEDARAQEPVTIS
jgi:hypothetical protein